MTRRTRALLALPTALLFAVYACDAALALRPSSTAVVGALDEPAHLATAALVLLAVRRPAWLSRHRAEVAAVLAATVLIDVDHLPLYAGVNAIAPAGGRPYSHSLLTVTVLVALSLILPPGRRRWPLTGAVGVCLHFLRDAVTGPGLTLWWPISDRSVVLPQEPYWLLLLTLAVLATGRLIPAVQGARTTGGRRADLRR